MLKTGSSTISVHFWNLGAYNAGILVGDWIDMDSCTDLDHFKAEISRVTLGAEEVLMGDHESEFGISLPEFPDLDKLWELHEALQDIDEDEREAFADYLAYHGGWAYVDTALTEWQDRYCGQWESLEDYAWNYAEDIYPDLANVPAGFRVQVDIIAWEQDHWISDNGHVFRCF